MTKYPVCFSISPSFPLLPLLIQLVPQTEEIKDIIQDLYEIMVKVTNYGISPKVLLSLRSFCVSRH